MHTISGAGDGDVGAGIDQDLSCRFAAAGRWVLADRANDGPGKRFQFAAGEVFFAQLNVTYAAAGGFGDPLEQRCPARGFVAGKLPAVGNVVEEQGLL